MVSGWLISGVIGRQTISAVYLKPNEIRSSKEFLAEGLLSSSKFFLGPFSKRKSNYKLIHLAIEELASQHISLAFAIDPA